MSRGWIGWLLSSLALFGSQVQLTQLSPGVLNPYADLIKLFQHVAMVA
ncbi:uncharacterized protein METZ01_LOCUS306051 [marine metagenome]|uniref:Uncharacterized protein n=1 Tax=marine metagenome TaxID=408172 RepID=A0A382MZA7_9ZZZZ